MLPSMELTSMYLVSIVIAQVFGSFVCHQTWQGLQVAGASVEPTKMHPSVISPSDSPSGYSAAQKSGQASSGSYTSLRYYTGSSPTRVILQYTMGRCMPTPASGAASDVLTGQQTTYSAMRILRNRVSQYMHEKKLNQVEEVASLSAADAHSLAAELPSRFLSALHMEVITAMPNGVAAEEVVRLSNGIPCIERAYRDSVKMIDDAILKQLHAPSTAGDLVGSANTEERERVERGGDVAARHSRDQVPPNDPYFKKQWNLRGDSQYSINAETAWKLWSGHNRPMIIAVIDSGCDIEHPDLVGNMWKNPGEICGDGVDNDLNGLVDDCHGWDFTRDSPAVAPEKGGHGTSSAGVMAASANNMMATAGVCWGCKVMCLKFFGKEEGLVSNQLQALNYALRNGAWISNNSYGGYGWSELEYEGIRRAQAAGHLFVASAGNHDVETDLAKHFHTPSSYPLSNIISVGASTQRGRKAEFSNYGKSSVHIFAPGTDIFATGNEDGVVKVSGTSFASPHVAGAAGLIWSAFPDLTYAQVKTALLESCRQVAFLRDKASCGGILDVYKALRIADRVLHFVLSTKMTAARISDGTHSLQDGENALRHVYRALPLSYTTLGNFTPFGGTGLGDDNDTRNDPPALVAETYYSRSAHHTDIPARLDARSISTGLAPFRRRLDGREVLSLAAGKETTRSASGSALVFIMRKAQPLPDEEKALYKVKRPPALPRFQTAFSPGGPRHHGTASLRRLFVRREVVSGEEKRDRAPRGADATGHAGRAPELEWILFSKHAGSGSVLSFICFR